MKFPTCLGLGGAAGVIACGLCLSLGLATTACKRSGPGATARVDERAFDSAPAEVKEAWNTALSAAKTNGWAAAYLTLMEMRGNRDLTEAQYQAIGAESTLVHGQLNEAAAKGDPEAQKALQEIRAASRQRGR